MTTPIHTYHARCTWTGSTGVGYEEYDRTHSASAPPAKENLTLSADPAFLGDKNAMNPESIVLVAASSCQLLSFLAVAARARVDVIGYEDDCEAIMPEDDRPVRISEIRLRPRITVLGPVSEDRLDGLVDLAHRECFIANSLKSNVSVAPTFHVVEESTSS